MDAEGQFGSGQMLPLLRCRRLWGGRPGKMAGQLRRIVEEASDQQQWTGVTTGPGEWPGSLVLFPRSPCSFVCCVCLAFFTGPQPTPAPHPPLPPFQFLLSDARRVGCVQQQQLGMGTKRAKGTATAAGE
jgi:hypothetical protein